MWNCCHQYNPACCSWCPTFYRRNQIPPGSVKIPVHFDLDINGMLSMSTLAESYELHEPLDVLPMATAGPDKDDDEQLEYGKGK